MKTVQDDTLSTSRLSASAICPLFDKFKAGWRRQPEVADAVKTPSDPETILARTVPMEPTKHFERL